MTLMIITNMSTSPQRKLHLVIVGGGFGGVRLARRLSGRSDIAITIISNLDFFAYYPQLYHSATGGVRTESAIPLHDMLSHRAVDIVRDTITEFDPAKRTLTGASGRTFEYDELVLALGSVTNFFGIKGLEEYAYNIKTIQGAERFKRHLHEELIERRRPEANYVIVGAGPTGVELAAALGDYLKRLVRLHRVRKPEYSIKLIEGAPRILPRSPEHMSAAVHAQLERLGVTVMTGQVVKGETADAITLAGQRIVSQTVVWTAGVANNPFFQAHAELFKLAKNGKVEVDQHLVARPHVRVIGDNAATQYSGMAQTALYDADYVAGDLVRQMNGSRRPAYRPKAPISVIPVGERWAAAQWGEFELYGLPGYVLRRLADLVGYADLESWPQAVQVWLDDRKRQDDCKICQPGIVGPEPLAARPDL
jgi:NADH dehydrogenase